MPRASTNVRKIGCWPIVDLLHGSRNVRAARDALPAFHSLREFTEVGGLMSYGTDIADVYRQMGVYTGRVLKGTKPADLPVVQSTKFEFVLNQKTARALGIEVPPNLLARADDVIE